MTRALRWTHLPGEQPKKLPKYRNVRVKTEDGTFDSKKELARWHALELLQQFGVINQLRRQPRYAITVEGHFIGTYVGDFEYFDIKRDEWVIEDVKSEATRKIPLYRWKKKLMRAVYGIEIREV